MRYALKKGVVLLRMCGEQFLVLSRESGLPPLVLSVSPEIASLLESEAGNSGEACTGETKVRLRQLTSAGLLEVR